ncbi:MAG: conjugal transfer protein TraR [Ignavibacteriae bacterium]|nr:conjugal transfer protein TraR [Ignavibacteriota bacterium]
MAKKTSAKTKPSSAKAAPKKTKDVKEKKAAAKKQTKVKVVVKPVKKSVGKTDTVKKGSVKKSVPTKETVKKVISPAVKKNVVKTPSKTKTGKKIEVVVTPVKPKVPKKIVGYPKKELDEFKTVILDKRKEIIEQLQNLKEQMMDETTGQYVNENSPYSLHMAEQGTDAQEREKLYLWAQRETKFLGYLEDALQRIDNGTYGICIDSLELPEGPHLIPKKRLLAVPHTQHCVDCKNKK